MENNIFFEEKDMEIIEKIAKKYNMSLHEFGKKISMRIDCNYRLQILLSSEEIRQIDKSANEKNLTRSKYCTLCYKKALKDKSYENIDIVAVGGVGRKGKTKKEHRAVISFDNTEEYKEMNRLADELGVPFSSLVRYFALNIKL